MEGNGASPGMKREYCDDSTDLGGGGKRARGSGPHVDLRALVPSRSAGAIIGKGGANIKRLRQEYNATVIVPDSDGPERVLNISCDLGSACEILSEIMNQLDSDRPGSDGQCQVRLLIHQSQAGGVIGKAGFKIKELREQFSCHVKVYSECCPQSSDRVVEIGGDGGTISRVTYAIYEFLETIPPRGMHAPYDPQNFDEFFAAEYGGYSSMDMGGGGRGRGGRGRGGSDRGYSSLRGGPMRGGARGGRGGGMGGAPVGLMGGDLGGLGRRGGFGGGGGGGGGMRGGMGGRGSMRGGGGLAGAPGFGGSVAENSYGGPGGVSFEAGDAAGTEFTQVSIPKEYAGAIIGRGGTRIKQIRMESGASITIDEPQPDSTDRIINISGSSEQIQNAQYLLQMSVKQSSGAGF